MDKSLQPWFFRDQERLKLERAGIDNLLNSSKWLVAAQWRFDGEFCLDAIICAHEYDYEVRISYPDLYPDVPSVVRPRNMKDWISEHQYGGPDGPLCLEWGSDNWHRDITSVQMLESTHKLLEIENPLGKNRPEIPVVAPSRHQLTIGQELRNKYDRWYVSKGLIDYFREQPTHSVGSFKFSYRKTGANWISLIHEALPLGGSVWRDGQIPTTLPGAESQYLNIGVWFKTDLDVKMIGSSVKLTELQELLADENGAKFLATDGTSPIENFGKPFSGVLIIDRAGDLHLFVFCNEIVWTCSKVISEESPVQMRSPDWSILNGKVIGIVGLGSVGSKIAISLARMGVRNFYLIDDDILLPENLQRHALDWQSVAQHKVETVKSAIDRITPNSQVEVCCLKLTGQESNAFVGKAVSRLAKCDLIIDATGNSKVFNLLAAIVRTACLPMIWTEVFGGGIGGLVSRSRPRVDPDPQEMRRVYLQFCNEKPYTNLHSTVQNYAVTTEEGKLLVASDADVSIIAHHAARFVPDCFLTAENSKFPDSMYLVGLSKEWVFEAPFSTTPISMEKCSFTGWDMEKESDFQQETIEFLTGLITKKQP